MKKSSLNDTQLYRAIDQFLTADDDSSFGNAQWLKGRYTRLYLRRNTYHSLDTDLSLRMLDVANVTVLPKYQSRGVFTNLMNWLETKNLPLYIENVHEERLNGFFLRRGYRRVQHLIDHCYYKLPQESHLTKS